MTRYARDTEVSSQRSREEIERTLQRYGATGFLYGWEGDTVMLGFRMAGRMVRFRLTMPPRSEFTLTETGRERTSQDAINAAWEQACRQRWRALALVIKAKLEAVESQITTFEEEFLAHILLPDGRTYGQFAVPQIAAAYDQGKMPSLLPAGKES